MTRGRYLVLAAASTAAMVGTAENGCLSRNQFEQWASCVGASVVDSPGGYRVVAAVPPDRLSGALQELEAFAQGPLRCGGRIATGTFQGRKICVELRIA